MWRNKQNAILIPVLILCVIILAGIKVYDQLQEKGGISEVKAGFMDDERLTKRQIINPGSSATSSSQDKKAESDNQGNAVIEPSLKEKGLSNNLESNGEKNEKSQDNLLVIKAVGDIMLGRGVEYHLDNQGRDSSYPFQHVAEVLSTADVVFGNLECPMTESSKSLDPSGKYILKCRPDLVESLKYAGFNILNLANNHIMDYYEKGLFDTMETLEKRGILYCGAGKDIREAREPAVMNVDGLRVYVLGYTDMAEYFYKGDPMIKYEAEEQKSGVAPRRLEYIKEDIESIQENADIIIVSLHWGVEDSFEVTKEQREFAYQLIDIGTDIILGHHPHKFQGVEIYKGKPIVYSMGNFIFDQNDPLKQESFILDMSFAGNELVSLELLPVRTIDKTHVIMPVGQDAMEMLNRELELCGKLGSKCAIINDKIVFNIKTNPDKEAES